LCAINLEKELPKIRDADEDLQPTHTLMFK
jgi:hypothetical protein